MNSSIERQDASGHMPLGVFLNGELVGTVNHLDDPYAEAAVKRIAATLPASTRRGFEVLALCHLHPNVSAVDCLDCEPVDEDI